jgi:hypothetical protein
MSPSVAGTLLPTRVVLIAPAEAPAGTLGPTLAVAGFELVPVAPGSTLVAAAQAADAPIALLDLPDAATTMAAAEALRASDALGDLFIVACHSPDDPVERCETIEGVIDRTLPSVVLPHLLRAFVAHAEARRAIRALDPTASGMAGALRELESLSALGGGSVAAVAARSLGLLPLKEASSAAFADLLKAYSRILDRAFEGQVLKVDTGITPRLRTLAEHLYFLRAGPRDVTDLHRAALQQVLEQEPAPRVQGYLEAGRLLVLELMGHLLSQYRAHDLPTARRRPAKPPTSDVPPTT